MSILWQPTLLGGRYKEYAQKRILKQVCKTLLVEGKIDPQKDVEIQLMFDQDSAISDGFYSIEDSIKVEFQKGMDKLQYGVSFAAIFHGQVIVKRQFCDSKIIDLIQAADFVAGSVRRGILDKDESFIEHVKNHLFLP